MFVLRGIAVSLTFFVLLYCLLSLLVACGWRYLKSSRPAPSKRQASLLFWARVSPLLAAAFVTLVLVVPSFILREPRAIDEDMGLPLALGAGCLLLFALGAFRVVAAQMRTARVVAGWVEGAHTLDTGLKAPTFCAGRDTPPLTLVGVYAPRVLVSEATVALLSPDELRVAVRHEMAHMRSRDNLKKLVFHCSPFPGMSALEDSWQEAAELAADDGAVASTRDALDLAAALIKLSRLIPVQATPAFTMALVGRTRSISERVARLLAWNETKAHADSSRIGYAIPVTLAFFLSAAPFYGPVLTETHRITEWLVR